MSWGCPNCGADNVVSRREWRAVYRWLAAIKRRGIRRVARDLAGYGLDPEPAEDAEDMVRRWAEGDTERPNYVCAHCVQPFSSQEVPQ